MSSYFSPYHKQSFSDIDHVSPHIPNGAREIHGVSIGSLQHQNLITLPHATANHEQGLYSYDTFNPPENNNNKPARNMSQNTQPSSALERYPRHIQPDRLIDPPLLSITNVHKFTDTRHTTTMPVALHESSQFCNRNFPDASARKLVPGIISLEQHHLWSVPDEGRGGEVERPISKRTQCRPPHVPPREKTRISGESSFPDRPRIPILEGKSVVSTPVLCQDNSIPKVRLPLLKERGNSTQHYVGSDQQLQTRFGDSRRQRFKKFKETRHSQGLVN